MAGKVSQRSHPFSHYWSSADSLCLRHNLCISSHPDFLLLPTPTGNEKYEIFLNQARKNLEKEYNKYEISDHLETPEEVSEDESLEVRWASLCTGSSFAGN